MKAALCREFGDADNLTIEDVDDPVPESDQVLIEVRACGVNFPDVLMIAGKYQMQPPMPFVPGVEISGVISKVGDDVSHLREGQRVLALADYGGMAEQICVSSMRVMPIPDAMPFATAAGFAVAYGTSYHALKQRARLAADESLLVLGAAGGVGLAAVELGSLLGARVIAAASSDDKLALAKSHGAEDLLNYTDTDLKSSLRELTGPGGVDVVYDPVGGSLAEQSLRCMAWNGRYLIVGFASGNMPHIAANLPLLKGYAVVGVFWGSFTEREPRQHVQNTRELLQYYEQGSLRPHVSQEFPLEQAAAAVKTLAERKATGKVVITVA